ncbi:MAG: endonuclease/exonuclease/phosphatase family protein [Candidatus Paceibacterota bacterium]
MKFLQWNIWYKEDVHNVLSFVKESGADIVCLQELTVNHPDFNQEIDAPKIIAEGLGFEYFYTPAVKSIVNGRKREFGNGIFTRYPIVGSRSIFIQDPPKSDNLDYSKEGRAYVEVTLETSEGELTVGTTHMSYTDKFESTPAKEVETNRLLALLKEKKEKFLFSGDLNALPDSYTVNEISKVLKNCGPAVSKNTWTTKPFSYNQFDANTLDWRIDYCFATSDVYIKSANVINTNFSDHLPILVEM